MFSKALMMGVLVLFCATLEATTYYISPTGNDAATGTTVPTPWKTFAFATPKLNPGDVLILLDGTYDNTNSGYLAISNLNGTATHPITFRAQNERKAHIHNNGLATSLYVTKCSYLNFEGLQLSSADNGTVTNDWTGVPMTAMDCHHLVMKRLLVHHNNRYGNTHLITLTRVTNSLVEESEFYYHHRHAIMVEDGSRNTFRRDYFNSRGYGATAFSRPNGHGDIGGDDGIAMYPGRSTIIENNIGEGHILYLVSVQSTFNADSNQILGNIALETASGVKVNSRIEGGATAAAMPKHNTIKDLVVLKAEGSAAILVSVKGQIFEQATLMDCRAGLLVGEDPSCGDGQYSLVARNILAKNNALGNFAFRGNRPWTLDHPNGFGTSGSYANYEPATSPDYISPLSVDPKMGTCKVWIPEGSPMKRSGKDGKDIGANVLYRYQDGVLTSQPLWDPATGEFPHGTIIAGINDVPGQSLFDVNKRLNVNCNSCPFPAGYPKTSSITRMPAGTGNLVGKEFLSITPNLAGSSISIRADAAHPAMFEIYSLQGKKIETLNSTSGSSVQWGRGNNPAGVYFVKASSRGITATVKALIAK